MLQVNQILLRSLISVAMGVVFFLSACSSGPSVQSQKYAKLKTEKTLEYEFPQVWKAVNKVTEKYKVVDRDPEEANELELRKTREGYYETDWVYSKSNDKYISYKVNGLPRKKYLQSRFKHRIELESVLGGVKVRVLTKEEIERLNDDGSPDGYKSVGEPDSARSNSLLKKIEMAILSSSSGGN